MSETLKIFDCLYYMFRYTSENNFLEIYLKAHKVKFYKRNYKRQFQMRILRNFCLN